MASQGLPGMERETRPEAGQPYAWLQWKGSDICADIHCVCGAMTHIDSDFTYYICCGDCGMVYWMNGHVELVEIPPEERGGLNIKDANLHG